VYKTHYEIQLDEPAGNSFQLDWSRRQKGIEWTFTFKCEEIRIKQNMTISFSNRRGLTTLIGF
jgi:hypothetical protein